MDPTLVVKGASSARRGLLEACEEHGALRLVVGARDGGSNREIDLGSIGADGSVPPLEEKGFLGKMMESVGF